jgi:integrase
MTLWKDKRRGVWRYSFQYRKKIHSGAGYNLKSKAAQAEADHKKRVKEAPTIREGMGFKEAANVYLDYARLRYVTKTYKYKAYVYKCFLRKIGNMNLEEITPQIIHNYCQTRPSASNYNRHRKDLSALFAYAIRHMRVIKFNPVTVLDQLPENPEPKEPPTEQQVLQLIAAAEPETEKPVLLAVLFTAGRIDEILRMKWEDVNFEKRTVTLWTKKRKGGQYEADKLPMIEDLYQVLRREWDRRKQNLWVFYNEKTGARYIKRPKMMKHLCMKIFEPGCKGLKHYKGPVFGFHALRHFMSTFLADSEKQSTKTVQKILRHKSPKTTERYMHSNDLNVLGAMKRLEGRFK